MPGQLSLNSSSGLLFDACVSDPFPGSGGCIEVVLANPPFTEARTSKRLSPPEPSLKSLLYACVTGLGRTGTPSHPAVTNYYAVSLAPASGLAQ